MSSRISDIKRAQKESLLLREISQLYQQAAMDNPELLKVSITHVKLSPNKGLCTIYFYTPEGEAFFKDLLETLKLYKPSLRKALASTIASRYVPELIFKYDTQFEKQMRIETLIEQVKSEDKS